MCCPGPFFSSVVLGGTAILNLGSDEQKDELLPRLANGKLILSLAATEPGNWYGMDNIQAVIREDGPDLILDGTKLFVENAHISDYILCVARTVGRNADTGLSLVLVDPNSPGVACAMLDTLAFEKQCEVVFDKVSVSRAHVLGELGGRGLHWRI
ncbi:hypothetical protein DSCA_37040 [Desulfosarcina alkanivorans]|uniref:Acyl-CoA oxidase/dehydrogenase middle domain-containing protein n=1 Tax=Desulfosarcina alkanivorans TaxID=571177 RepID=A0A5K7YU16_9BACT|nr:acyl-CoA dehydrogenase family protein [Desulfosarcina alkanivorans]BBO69774.1 hypothetical protein DSCA_37040 [Desulfosarcina alkanivorans]